MQDQPKRKPKKPPKPNPDKAAFAGSYGGGLTKREYLAGQAMAGLLAFKGPNYGPGHIAEHAIIHAEVLLVRLKLAQEKEDE